MTIDDVYSFVRRNQIDRSWVKCSRAFAKNWGKNMSGQVLVWCTLFILHWRAWLIQVDSMWNDINDSVSPVTAPRFTKTVQRWRFIHYIYIMITSRSVAHRTVILILIEVELWSIIRYRWAVSLFLLLKWRESSHKTESKNSHKIYYWYYRML